jgi:hypothetical protein
MDSNMPDSKRDEQNYYLLPEGLGKSLLQYLGNRPYIEVAGFISAITNLPVVGSTAEMPPVPAK